MFGMKGLSIFFMILLWTGFQWTTGEQYNEPDYKTAEGAFGGAMRYYPNGTVVPRRGWR